jgi:hypothetical protein
VRKLRRGTGIALRGMDHFYVSLCLIVAIWLLFAAMAGYAQEFPPHLKLPATLWDAAQQLKRSSTAQDWELARYFEII